MSQFSAFFSLPLAVLACGLPVGAAGADVLSDKEQIAAIREQSNQAIARHDVAGVLASFDDEYQVTSGRGELFQETHDERLAHWQEIFAVSEDIIYTRSPQTIEVSTYLPRAAEHGRWTGSWTSRAGRQDLGGSYTASWSKVDGVWKIRSEIFITLFCKGPGC